jgi:hypothetical protein
LEKKKKKKTHWPKPYLSFPGGTKLVVCRIKEGFPQKNKNKNKNMT